MGKFGGRSINLGLCVCVRVVRGERLVGEMGGAIMRDQGSLKSYVEDPHMSTVERKGEAEGVGRVNGQHGKEARSFAGL